MEVASIIRIVKPGKSVIPNLFPIPKDQGAGSSTVTGVDTILNPLRPLAWIQGIPQHNNGLKFNRY